MQSPADGHVGRADDLRDLGAGQPLELAQRQHRLEVRCEGLQNLLHLGGRLHRLGVIARRGLVLVLELHRAIVLLDPSGHRVGGAALAQEIDAEVRDDPIEPRREVVAEIEAVEAPEHPQEGLLCEVLRILVGGHQVPGHAVRPALMALDQTPEGVLLSRLRPLDERVIDGGLFLARGHLLRCLIPGLRHAAPPTRTARCSVALGVGSGLEVADCTAGHDSAPYEREPRAVGGEPLEGSERARTALESLSRERCR